MVEKKETLREKLRKVQSELKAPKDLNNSFGGYKYRSAESILEAVKPLLKDNSLTLTISDDVIEVGGRIYIKVTATLTDDIDTLAVTALAREAMTKKGMDESQITGAASSYARKYALNGLFLIDDTKDADTDEYQKQNDAMFNKKAEAEKKAQEALNKKIDGQLKRAIAAAEKAGASDGEISAWKAMEKSEAVRDIAGWLNIKKETETEEEIDK